MNDIRTATLSLLAAIVLPHVANAQLIERSVSRPPRSVVIETGGVVRQKLNVPDPEIVQRVRAMLTAAMPSTTAPPPGLSPPEFSFDQYAAALSKLATVSVPQTTPLAPPAAPTPAFVVPTAGLIIGGLIGLTGLLDGLLDQVDAIISSQLFAIRSHMDATIADLNVVFRDRLDQAFNELEAAEQRLLTQAHILLDKSTIALKDLEQQGFEHARLLLCDAAATAANTQLISIDLGFFQRPKRPDIICLETPSIRDPGSNHESLLQFRGVNLMPNEEYANTRLTIASLPGARDLPSAGGNTTLQVVLPGGINGDFNDTRPRGNYVGSMSFTWQESQVERRWMFVLKPFVVRSIEASITPIVDVPLYAVKSDVCSVHAEGGALTSRTARNTCVLTVDTGYTATACRTGAPPLSANGDAGVEHGPLLGAGSCTWGLVAESDGFFGAGAWYTVNIFMDQRGSRRIAAPTFIQRQVVNQGTQQHIVMYDPTLLPTGSTNISYTYIVRITDNLGRSFTLTDTAPSDPNIGSAAISSIGVLTITLLNWQ